MCYRCGEKYVPGQQCATQAPAQVKAIQQVEVLSDELLDAISCGDDTDDESNMHVSLNALAGTEHCNSLRLQALVGNKVMLILVDSGSSHSFIDASLVQSLNCDTQPIPVTSVKVANGQYMTFNSKVPNLC